MTTFYTTEQIDEQAGVIGRYLKTVSTDLTEYIDTSVLSEEVSISYDDVNFVHNVVPKAPRVTGTLNVEFYAPR